MGRGERLRAAAPPDPRAAKPDRRPVVGILLAAGAGTRFDRSGTINKLHAPLAGLPLACHAARLLIAHCAHVVAVTAPDDAQLRSSLATEGCATVSDPRSAQGLGYSLAAGVLEARRRHDPALLVVLPGDMPAVRTDTLARLLALPRSRAAILAPCHDGQRGYPLVFGAEHFERLTRCTDDASVVQLLARQPVTLLDVDDPGIVQDIDFRADLVTLRFDGLV